MKTKNLLLILSVILFSFSAFTLKNKTIEFKVSGNCGMCKKTIESSLNETNGIKSAVWNKETKMIKVSFDPAKISEEQIHQQIADAGYDTEKIKASDSAYDNLHGCCKYKRTLHP